MSTYKNLTTACIAAALALGLAACSSGDDSADVTPVEPPPVPTEPQPQDVTMDVALGDAEMAALMGVLGESGTSDTLTIEAGGTATRATVVFTCESAYPCTVTVTNSLGTILASVTTQMLPDADDPMVMAMIPLPPEALPRLNAANGASIASILDSAVEDSTNGPPASPHGNASTSIGGLGLDDFGAYNADELSITSDLDPNTALAHTPGTVDLATGDVTAGAGGSTVMASPMEDETDETMDNPQSVAAAGWDQKTLFRDWGDTAGLGDGGYETGLLVYNNMEDPTAAPFDGDLAAMFANAYVQRWFTLGVDTDADGTNDTVAGINGANENWMTPLRMISINVEGSQAAAVQINVPAVAAASRSQANEYRGTYFGAPGTFACIGDAACVIERAATGDVDFMIADTNAAADGIQTAGTWDFTPDPEAMIMVPDQDWVVFGAWLTAPDDASGEHRVGVFYDGMQLYARDNSGLELDGTATYSGAATGVYVDGSASGLFTAEATLTANFDVVDTANDNMLSGRIDNFRDTAGRFLGADTAANPNDPVAGGENDWVVLLNATAIGATDTVASATDGTGLSGSADGVQWDAGEWTAQLYGPEMDADSDPTFPSAVGGQFRAEIWGPGPADGAATDENSSPVTAVVGAFGAEID